MLAWRFTKPDWSSPWAADAPAGQRHRRDLLTPPGAVVEEPRFGIYAVENTPRFAHWSCTTATENGWRVAILEYDEENDVRSRGTQALRLHRARVIGEVTPDEIQAVLAGGNPAIPVGRLIAEDLFEQLLPHVPASTSRIHGLTHWRRVAENGRTLCAHTPDADPEVVAAFAALHDSCRENDGRDPEHGTRAASLAHQLQQAGILPLNHARLRVLRLALIAHDRGEVSTDPTIGVCWDADRLDLVRLGRRVNPALLSTDAGKRSVSTC